MADLTKQNPAERPGKPTSERRRGSFLAPTRKLEVPEIPGYYLYWVRGTYDEISRAMNAGFEFVTQDEVKLNNTSLGTTSVKSGNTDLGSRVSVIAGSELDETGQPLRLYLMKQKWEYHLEDLEELDKRNQTVIRALVSSTAVGGPAPGETAADVAARYVDRQRTRIPDLFRRKG
jgi:hypothetical protein